MTTYRIVRKYQNDNEPEVEVETGLTLQQAQAYCKDPETSSTTCTSVEGKEHTRVFGPWFDSYSEEE